MEVFLNTFGWVLGVSTGIALSYVLLSVSFWIVDIIDNSR